MNNGLLALQGWVHGYQYSYFKGKEDEIKQGKNYILASLQLTPQVLSLVGLINSLIKTVLQNAYKNRYSYCLQVPALLSLPIAFVAANVKEGKYEPLASMWNNHKLRFFPALPETLSEKTVNVLSAFLEYTGKVAQVAVIVTSVALIVLGNSFMGGAALLALGYDVIDKKGWVPYKASLAMEKYMPTIALVGSIVFGNALEKLFSSALLLSYLGTPFIHFIQREMVARIWKNHELKQIDAPIQQKRDLSFTEINKILHATDDQFIAERSHASKNFFVPKKIQNRNLDQLMVMFQQIEWKRSLPTMCRMLKDDDRFIGAIKDKFLLSADTKKEEVQNKFDFYLNAWANQENLEKDFFVIGYVTKQMRQFVNYVTTTDRVIGSQEVLEKVINDSQIILDYLIQLDPQKNSIEIADVFLKLAIEGGDYCSLGLDRVTSEVVKGNVILADFSNKEMISPQAAYELRIQIKLQKIREHLKQESEHELINLLKKLKMPLKLNDIHSYEEIAKVYLGFYPLEDRLRNVMFSELYIWHVIKEVRTKLLEIYQEECNEAFEEKEEILFGEYMQKFIGENPLLNTIEKEQLLSLFTCDDDIWTPEDTQKRFHRLMLVILGVLKFKSY